MIPTFSLECSTGTKKIISESISIRSLRYINPKTWYSLWWLHQCRPSNSVASDNHFTQLFDTPISRRFCSHTNYFACKLVISPILVDPPIIVSYSFFMSLYYMNLGPLHQAFSKSLLSYSPCLCFTIRFICVLMQVFMKPGKPLTFAQITTNSKNIKLSKPVLAFGFPGNPVSCLVCFNLFAVPAIRHLSGWANPQLQRSLFIHSLQYNLISWCVKLSSQWN